MSELTLSQRLKTWVEADPTRQRLIEQASTGSAQAISFLREQFGPDSDLQQTAHTLLARVRTNLQGRTEGRTDVGGGHPSGFNQSLGQVPANGDAARIMLESVQIATSGKLQTRAEIAPAHKILKAKYKEDYAETLKAEVEYAKDSHYEIRLVTDKVSKEDFGVASGWHLGKTGFQIDYLSPIEWPREGNESRDVTAGLAIMRQMANRHHASGLWVEVDEEMRKHYDAAGFKVIAQPHPEDKAQLTMMYLPLTKEAEERFEKDPTGLWKDHIGAWYEANWDSLKGTDAAPARDALGKMYRAADNGQRVWIQSLPE
jgi:hypothetical protein